MLKLIVNGEEMNLAAPCSLEQALAEWGYRHKHVAVAVEGDFVPRHGHGQFTLRGGERVEVLSPMQGG